MINLRPVEPLTITLVVAVVTGSLAGCADTAPFDYVPVSGTITYDDGKFIPAASIRLTFDPQIPPIDEQTYPRKGSASVDVSTGRFDSVTSYRPGDGLVAGRHKVIITTMDESGAVVPLVAAEYMQPQTTPLSVHTDDAPLEMRVPRPSTE